MQERCALVPIGDRQFFGREQRDHPAALVGNHDLFLDACRGIAVLGRAIGFQREHHAFLDLGRVFERNHARDDRPFVQCQAEAVAELQPNAAISSGKPKSCAFGHTLHTLSVVTPGLISAMALSTHSRARL